MFVFATVHLVVNCIRLLQGFVDFRLTPGPAAYLKSLRPWNAILKDTLFVTQEILGGAAATYRCWILWSKDWKIIVLPIALLLANCGYTVCVTSSMVDPTDSIFSERLDHWATTFYSVAAALNIITTGLMAYRIWSTLQRSADYIQGRSRLVPVFYMFIESAALQLLVEIVLLALYCSNVNVQYILGEAVVPIVGITFNLITIRLKLHVMAKTLNQSPSNHLAETIGSMPLRRIRVKLSQDVEHVGSDLDPKKQVHTVPRKHPVHDEI
ncbi:hypothetical protein DXG01_007079 [Tephrocybe rancida]|nr:hypothetical protein DXG01_007079 [Tephrocybe rancida]